MTLNFATNLFPHVGCCGVVVAAFRCFPGHRVVYTFTSGSHPSQIYQAKGVVSSSVANVSAIIIKKHKIVVVVQGGLYPSSTYI